MPLQMCGLQKKSGVRTLTVTGRDSQYQIKSHWKVLEDLSVCLIGDNNWN